MNRCLVLLAVAFAATFAKASYLIWQVNPDDYANTGMTATDANLYSGSTLLGSTANIGTPVQVDVRSLGANDTFFVEMVNWTASGSEVVARSEEASYESLAGSLFTEQLSDISMVQAWHASNYKAVPEPTSGFLMMVGLALLGLKRRKV